MDLLRFSVPQLAEDFKKIVFQNRNSSRRSKRFITLSIRFGTRLTLFIVITALFLSGLSLMPDNRLSRGAQVSAATEAINTFASDCTTPDADFNLGQTVCAVATDTVPPIFGLRQRRIQWVAPDGVVAQQVNVNSNPQSNSFAIPAAGPFAQVGTWTVKTIDNSGSGRASTRFIVRNPAVVSTDVSVTKSGPGQAAAGTNITYTVSVINRGPDDAQNVVLTDGVPANTTFVSETQISGPSASCTNPSAGSATGATVCTIATLATGASAVFSITYAINSGVAEETEITNTATVTSTTSELHTPDNTVTATTLVTANAEECTVTCPGDITQAADNGQCTAAVNYSSATGAGGNCDTIECSPPAGSTFPSGTTTVTCAAATGDPCTFRITVTGNDEQAPTIICPGDVTTQAAPSSTVRVDFPEPETIDNCSAVTVSCSPASGSSFPIGTTTVTCTATDASNNSANCTFSVIVTESVVNCALACGPDITKTIDPSSCGAVVEYSPPATTGTCGDVECTPSSGSTFPVGFTVVTCTGADGANCSFSVTVNDPVAPTITACASNKVIAADSECMAVMPDLTGEVVASDNCSPVVILQSPPDGELLGVGNTVVTIRVSDASGNEATCTATVSVVESTPPVINCPANINTVDNAPNACGALLNPGPASATDNCGIASIVGTRSDNAALNALYPVGTTTITWKATDLSGNFSTCQQTVTVTNPNAAITITGPAAGSLFQINSQVPFRATFTDNLGDTHTAEWMFDAITASVPVVVEPTASTSGTANLDFAFTTPGVYLIKLKITDDCGNVTITETVGGQPAFIVVFDPEGEFVTGGGWINSPAGSLVADPTRTGRSNFGFNAKYHNGETTPRGETEFRFGNFNFHSTSYEWLVITGAKLQFKGSGKVNGSGDYGFMLTAIDGNVSGGGGTDKFRIKIWNKNNNNAVVYDTQMGAADSADLTTALGGGNIVIHH